MGVLRQLGWGSRAGVGWVRHWPGAHNLKGCQLSQDKYCFSEILKTSKLMRTIHNEQRIRHFHKVRISGCTVLSCDVTSHRSRRQEGRSLDHACGPPSPVAFPAHPTRSRRVHSAFLCFCHGPELTPVFPRGPSRGGASEDRCGCGRRILPRV